MPTRPDGAVAQARLAERVVLLAPFPGPQITLGLRKLAHGAQQQPERGVGDLLGQHVGRVGERNAMRAQPSRRIDVVVADAEGRDDLQLAETGP